MSKLYTYKNWSPEEPDMTLIVMTFTVDPVVRTPDATYMNFVKHGLTGKA